MSHIKFFIVSFISVWLISCQQSVQETQYANKTLTDTTDTVVSFQDSQLSLNNKIDNPQKITVREGTHNLSLQWISWEELGEVEIKYLEDNIYSIAGEQRSANNSDYLKIKGTLEPRSGTELIFNGIVEHQITHLNQGQPCVKEGKQTFKSTQNRKYWRMQDMRNCEGGSVTDYIDIYF